MQAALLGWAPCPRWPCWVALQPPCCAQLGCVSTRTALLDSATRAKHVLQAHCALQLTLGPPNHACMPDTACAKLAVDIGELPWLGMQGTGAIPVLKHPQVVDLSCWLTWMCGPRSEPGCSAARPRCQKTAGCAERHLGPGGRARGTAPSRGAGRQAGRSLHGHRLYISCDCGLLWGPTWWANVVGWVQMLAGHWLRLRLPSRRALVERLDTRHAHHERPRLDKDKSA